MSYSDILNQFNNYLTLAESLNSSNIPIPNVNNSLQISTVQNNLQSNSSFYSNVLSQPYFNTSDVQVVNQVLNESKSAIDTATLYNSNTLPTNQLTNTIINNLLLSYGFNILTLPIYIKQSVLSNLVQNYQIKGSLQSVENMIGDIVNVPILISELYFTKWCHHDIFKWFNLTQEFPQCMNDSLNELNVQPYTENIIIEPKIFKPLTPILDSNGNPYNCGVENIQLPNQYNPNQTLPYTVNGYIDMGFTYLEPYNTPASNGVLNKYLPYNQVVDKYWFLTEDYCATEYPFNKAMSPYFITKLFYNFGDYLYGSQLLRQYTYIQYINFINSPNTYQVTRNITSEYLPNPYNFLEAWYIIRYLWMAINNIQYDNTDEVVRGRYQYFYTGTILSYNNNGNIIFYGGAYCQPNGLNQNTIIMVGMDNNTITINSSNTNIPQYTITYDSINNQFDCNVDLANFVLNGSQITETTPVYLYGNGNQLLANPSITTQSNLANYTGTVVIGGYGPGITFNPTTGTFTGYLDLLLSYDFITGQQTLLSLIGQENQIIVNLNGLGTYANLDQINQEWLFQFATRYNTSFSSIQINQLPTSQQFTTEEKVILDYQDTGLVKMIDLQNRTNFQITYSGNKIIVFGGYLNSQITDELIIIDPNQFNVLNIIHTGIFLINPLLISLGHKVTIYGGYNSDNSLNNQLYIIHIDNYQLITVLNSGYIFPYSDNNYVTISPNSKLAYITTFDTTNNTANIYRMKLEGFDTILIGQITNINQNSFSAICDENNNLYMSYFDLNNNYHIGYYENNQVNIEVNLNQTPQSPIQEELGIIDITENYFNSLPDIYISNIFQQLCKLNNPLQHISISQSFINRCNNILSNFINQYIFNNQPTIQTSTINISNTLLNDINTIPEISKYINGTLLNYIINYTSTPLNLVNNNLQLDNQDIESFQQLFSLLWYYTTDTYFDWNNIPNMYYNYMNNILISQNINNLFIDSCNYISNNINNCCDINSLPENLLTQVYSNFNYNGFITLLNSALINNPNILISLLPIPANKPMISIINNINPYTESSIQKRYIGNLSPSIGLISDQYSDGTNLYLMKLKQSIINAVNTVQTTDPTYTPTLYSARTFRDILLGYPNSDIKIGTRDFDLECSYPLIPQSNTYEGVGNILNTFNPQNFQTIYNSPNKQQILYDVLSAASKLTQGVDFTLLYTPYTLNYVEQMANMFKPIQSRSIYYLPTVNVEDALGEWVALSQSYQINLLKQLDSYLTLNESYQFALTMDIEETEKLTDYDIIQVTAIEDINFANLGNVPECYAYCEANYL